MTVIYYTYKTYNSAVINSSDVAERPRDVFGFAVIFRTEN